jgi:hypothetical protein
MGNSCSLLCSLYKSNKNNKIHPDNIIEKPKKKSNKKSKKIKHISKNETDKIPDTRI